MYLRPYKAADAETILSWCRDERAFRKWTSDRYPSYPITAREMNEKYFDHNGDCPEADNFYPMTACEDGRPLGHFILRYVGGDRRVLRAGFVIVDPERRGRGVGREMLRLALEYAFRICRAERVTIGVFENNPPALRCYRAAGFREVPAEPETCELLGETWRVVEMAARREDFFSSKGRA